MGLGFLETCERGLKKLWVESWKCYDSLDRGTVTGVVYQKY